MRFIFLICLQLSLFAADFDCVIVGSSPFSLFEALYQCHSGKKVLILEEASACGGAWKAIDICGIANADLGCHQIGQDLQLKAFLEKYAGCKIVSMDNPLLPFDSTKSPNGYYFSQGCFELIDHLLKLIAATDIVLMTETKVETVAVDTVQKLAFVQTARETFTTDKLIVTPMSYFCFASATKPQTKSKYYHLYLLIQDPTPPRFTYHSGLVAGVSRVMNLTHYVGIADTGRQLIIVQTNSEKNLSNGQEYLHNLIEKNLVDKGAYILQEETYIYEAGSFQQGIVSQLGAQNIVEVLQTGHFASLANYIPKWKGILKPYEEALKK